MATIGLLNEKPLHASLKKWYAAPGDQCEVTLEGYVIDLVHNNMLIEIQTANFSSILTKLTHLLHSNRVRLVFPIAKECWIIKQPDRSVEKPSRRKSPKKGRIEDIFQYLVSIPHLLIHPNFSIEVIFIHEENIRVRCKSPQRAWRKKGWRVEERRLLGVVGRRLFQKPMDMIGLLPANLEDEFTTKDLAKSLHITLTLAQKMAYCLHKTHILERVGKRGNSYVYSIA